MRVIVGMPTFNAPPALLVRAVKSVLDQTYDDLTLVVVNDGGSELVDMPANDRLVVYQLPRNCGQYFAASIVTEALADHPDVLWTEHDHDDWSEPEAIESRLPHLKDGAVVSPFWMHAAGQAPRVVFPQERALAGAKPSTDYPLWHKTAMTVKRMGAPVPELRSTPWRAGALWWSGLYTSRRVQLAGGLRPDFRAYYDKFFVRTVALTGPVGIAEYPGYHHYRSGTSSLSQSHSTGFGTGLHRSETDRKIEINRRIFAGGGESVRDAVRGGVDAELWEKVHTHASKLEQILF